MTIKELQELGKQRDVLTYRRAIVSSYELGFITVEQIVCDLKIPPSVYCRSRACRAQTNWQTAQRNRRRTHQIQHDVAIRVDSQITDSRCRARHHARRFVGTHFRRNQFAEIDRITTNLELIFTILGEESTRSIAVERDAQGFEDN